MAADLAAFADALALSLGSRSSVCRWAAASRSPSRATAPARVDAARGRGHRPRHLRRRNDPRGHVDGALARAVPESRAGAGLPPPDQPALHRGDAPPSRRARYASAWKAGSPGNTTAGCATPSARARGVTRSTSGRSWRDIACPILLVRGADSDVLSRRNRQAHAR